MTTQQTHARGAGRKKPRNRAAQDVNLINLRALKARVAVLEQKVKSLDDVVTSHLRRHGAR